MEALQSTRLENAVLARFVLVFRGREATVPGLKRARLEGVGLGVSKLGNECWDCTGFCRWLCVCAGRKGREMVPAGYFVPGGVS